jgi:anti-anti-sigma regulatory factor/DNA-binding HxlR family transcriptional regulator
MVSESAIKEQHVEDFTDTTIEWLSSDPQKGILIDFSGVDWVCDDFIAHLANYYADLKQKGIYVRFVNVRPEIKPYVDISDITVVLPIPEPEKPTLSAKVILRDLANELTDSGLMRKYGLSSKGLASMYKKLLDKGLIDEDMIEQRRGPYTATIVVPVRGFEDQSKKVVVDAGEAVKDVLDNVSNNELMAKYRLSEKGLMSMLKKLYKKGLIGSDVYLERLGSDPD